MVDLIEAVLRALPSVQRRRKEGSVEEENRVMDSIKGLDGTEGENITKNGLQVGNGINREDESEDEGNYKDWNIPKHSKAPHDDSDIRNRDPVKAEDAMEVVDNTKANGDFKVKNDTQVNCHVKAEVDDTRIFDDLENAIQFEEDLGIENITVKKSPGAKLALRVPRTANNNIEYHPKGSPEPPGIYCVMTSNLPMLKSLHKIPQAQPAVHLLKKVLPRKLIRHRDAFVTDIANHTSILTSNDGHPGFNVEPIPLPGVVMESGVSIRVYEIAPRTEIKLHRTTSTDYIVIQKGFICYLTPKEATDCDLKDIPLEETFLYEGDILVQRSTMHGWVNTSDGWVRMAAITVVGAPASTVVIGGDETRHEECI